MYGCARFGLVLLAAASAGCAAVRYADYKAPGLRFDRPHNRALPPDDSEAVGRAQAQWAALSEEERQAYPTPYHVYAASPDAGWFEGAHVIGLAFSGGGTRGVVFGAACVKELEGLGAVSVGDTRIDLIAETDYVSGVSTGAVPAAVYALNFGPHCPERLRFAQWPDCFNVDVMGYGLGTLARRPDWVLRDFLLEMNTRATMSGALAALFFEGSRYRPASGLSFGHLPRTPVAILGATVINDPAAPFAQTRMAYRYALDEYPDAPWQPGIQSFESFHTDPLPYPLGEACHNSLAYPGSMSSGLVAVQPDRDWVLAGIEGPARERMERARTRALYAGVCEVKDGGLADNRGTYLIARLFESRANGPRPLLIALDASQLELRMPEPDTGVFRKGWLDDLVSSMTASWQTGQDAYRRMVELQAEQGRFDLVDFRYTAWVPFLPGVAPPGRPETAKLIELCRAEPLVGTPERLLETARGIGTSYTGLSEAQMAAVRVAARFAVWLRRRDVLDWASAVHGGEPATFSAGFSAN